MDGKKDFSNENIDGEDQMLKPDDSLSGRQSAGGTDADGLSLPRSEPKDGDSSSVPEQELFAPDKSNDIGPAGEKKKKPIKKILIILLAVLLAAGGGYLLYKNSQNKNDSNTTATHANKDIEQLKIGIVGGDYGVPYPNNQNTSYASLASAQMFEGLVGYEGKNKIVPLLATDWSNPDNDTWVFNLKRNVKFHNGHIMKAADVKYSIEKIQKDNPNLAPVLASTIKSVEAVTDLQVKITTDGPDPVLLNKLTRLYIIDSQPNEGDEPTLAGSGPYVVKFGTKYTNLEVQMTAFDNYHGKRPYTRTATFGGEETTEELLKAYKEGKYNIIGDVSEDDAKTFPAATRFVTSEPETAYIGVNVKKPGPLLNKQVRKAFRYAIDPVQLARAQGFSAKVRNQIIPEEIPGFNPAIPTYERDINKAKQLLKDAGYPNGINVTLSHSTSKAKEFEVEITRQLKEANINVTIDYHEDFDEYNEFNSLGKSELYYLIWVSDALDGLDMLTSTAGLKAYYDNPALSEKLEKARFDADPKNRLKVLQEASKIVDEDTPVIPLSARDNIWIMDKDYAIKQDLPDLFLSVFLAKTHLK